MAHVFCPSGLTFEKLKLKNILGPWFSRTRLTTLVATPISRPLSLKRRPSCFISAAEEKMWPAKFVTVRGD
jgi:hypothetical protein